jgi:two-component system sensor histidine kinase KdpD
LKRAAINQPQPWRHYAWSAGLVAIATVLGFPLRSFINPINLVMLYLLVVVIAAIRLGRRPAIVASLLSVVAFNYIFVPPYYTYVVSDAQFLLTLAALLGVGIVISTLTAQARDQVGAAQRQATQTAVLYELSRDLAAAAEPEGIAQIIVNHIHQIFKGQATILLPGPDQENLQPCLKNTAFAFDKNEAAVAMWTFQHNQPAGHGTDTLGGVKGLYLPLETAHHVIGVLGIHPAPEAGPLTPEQRRLLESFANQAAQAIRRVQLADEASQAQLLRETEKLQTALLNSISHDLRTPLASITGALSSLRDDAAVLDVADRSVLISTAWEQAYRLNNLVGNLLEMTRLESGAMRVKKEACDIQDLVGVALTQLEHRLDNRTIEVDMPDSLPLVPLDFVLMVQVLVNVLDNALKYSPVDRPVNIAAYVAGGELAIEVIDQGLGIPEKELASIFDKFYRLPRSDGVSGTGLGLSISKGIVEAHGGRIWSKNKEAGGTTVTITLPLEFAPAEVK